MSTARKARKACTLAGKLLIGLLVLAWILPVQAGTTGFDDLPTSYNGTLISNGYAGLNWNNFYYLTATNRSAPSGYVNGMVSSPNVAFNGNGANASFTAASPFTFNGAYFTAAWNNGLTVRVTGSNNGTDLFSRTFTIDTTGPTHEIFNWAGIDQVLFASSGGTPAGFEGFGTHFAMDNLAINVHAVPEPSEPGLLVLGLGLTGLLVWRRRRVQERLGASRS